MIKYFKMVVSTIVLMLSMISTAWSQQYTYYMTGNELYAKCKGDVTNILQCQMYIAGVVDAYSGFKICKPKEVTVGQVVAITTTFLENAPSLRHYPAEQIILESVKAFFPCKEEKPRNSTTM